MGQIESSITGRPREPKQRQEKSGCALCHPNLISESQQLASRDRPTVAVAAEFGRSPECRPDAKSDVFDLDGGTAVAVHLNLARQAEGVDDSAAADAGRIDLAQLSCDGNCPRPWRAQWDSKR